MGWNVLRPPPRVLISFIYIVRFPSMTDANFGWFYSGKSNNVVQADEDLRWWPLQGFLENRVSRREGLRELEVLICTHSQKDTYDRHTKPCTVGAPALLLPSCQAVRYQGALCRGSTCIVMMTTATWCQTLKQGTQCLHVRLKQSVEGQCMRTSK